MVTIAIQGLSADLGRRAVLTSVSATLRPGTLTGVIGPNGAGKSTLVRAMLGLVPIMQGSVTIDGRDVAALRPRELARTVAYLPQGQTLHWPLSVERLVALGRLPHLAPMSRIGAEDRAAVLEAMTRADVAHLSARIVTELSGGERARVMLARALAVGAKGIVADEPLASLDPGHQIDVMELLSREAKAGALVVTVLHDLTMAARYCDRLLLIDRGVLVAEGTPREVLSADRLRTVYGVSGHIDMAGTAPMVVPLGRCRERGE
ncbi:ABC transporter ATP-binding protein [Novosphingobium sp. AP12]|uniref:ABC transporter ATP-binding protein n=1 Tax=Novosphingobium sp. AP12 TaxID=1144305 RepID=UPI00027219E4|nr:ABC transporter ATP-binding protein [Novosphingobium sp. AP12]EJL28243.1 ABC-type cobalamin/Fe3+-siderophore transport system, ATPase component [Novosphingobium sp. AP12]